MIRKILIYFFHNYTPRRIKNIIYRKAWKLNKKIIDRDRKIRQLIVSDRPVRILFIVSSLPMWRAQGLYDLLIKDNRFDPRIIISPFKKNNQEESIRNANQIIRYFEGKNVKLYNILNQDFNLCNFLDSEFDPDIMFPSQYYTDVYGNELDIEWNMHRIYCHIPYALLTINDEFAYNYEYHNICWKVYLPTQLHYKTACRMMANKAKNIKIVGDPDYDKFIQPSLDPWKKVGDGRIRKRIIWAPHYSISSGSLLHRTSFLWLYDEMLKIALEFKDKIQIAFKPHPHLHSVLLQLDGWGAMKTDEYYKQWAKMENTQIEEGNFIDLFKYSDAMIHDCGSFTGEYLFVNKPVMFITKNSELTRKGADDFGLKCLDLHYIGHNIKEIRNFIENVVLNEHDTLLEKREHFRKEYLIPPLGETVAQNIYKDLVESLSKSKTESQQIV